MLKKIILLANLLILVNCGKNNLPEYNPRKKIFDCTDGMAATDICNIMFVIEPLTSMTYYNITDQMRELRGFRARFEPGGELVALRPPEKGVEGLLPPIQTDGHFRPIIAINGQMPGPTIIAHENQKLNITVYNELKNVEGISIHWHGMHHRDTQGADGVAYITQHPTQPGERFTYEFSAFPSGTHWYHAHSGAQRTDGMYGALIVKDTLPGDLYDKDYPEQHTLLLMDWQREASIDLFYTIGTSLRYWKEPEFLLYNVTRSSDDTEVGATPFWSAIINDKGRHYDDTGQTDIRPSSLNFFNVSQGNRYRFRLIGAQALYAFRFSIEGHKMTVVATDGNPINPIEDVDYVILNTGERYDVIVHANANSTGKRNFWIWAETLEDPNIRNETFYNPINKHRAEAILHYVDGDETINDNIDELRICNSSSMCKAVNCPFRNTSNMYCVNADEFESLQNHDIPEVVYSPNDPLFFNFGFDGERSTSGSSLDGVNFRFPVNPPLTEYTQFQNSGDMCPNRGCDHDEEHHCACTQVIDISDQANGSVAEFVLTNRVVDTDRTSPAGTSHPIHLHGHYFYVVKIGYPEYHENYTYKTANDDIACTNSADQPCPRNFITGYSKNNVLWQRVHWRNNTRLMDLDIRNKSFARKDTVIVPYGGYTVIRFVVDNPGWWFFHCHIEIHQLEGMAAVVNELPPSPPDNTSDNGTCVPMKCTPCNTGGSQSNLKESSVALMMVIGLLAIISTVLV